MRSQQAEDGELFLLPFTTSVAECVWRGGCLCLCLCVEVYQCAVVYEEMNFNVFNFFRIYTHVCVCVCVYALTVIASAGAGASMHWHSTAVHSAPVKNLGRWGLIFEMETEMLLTVPWTSP